MTAPSAQPRSGPPPSATAAEHSDTRAGSRDGPATATGGAGTDGAVWEQGRMRVLAARAWVARYRPYYARALFACPIEFTESRPTVSIIENWLILANPRYTATLTVPQAAAVLIHELNHTLRDHHSRSVRAGVPDHLFEVWKVAADCEINDDLTADGLELPEGLIYPHKLGFKPRQLAEHYYRELLARAEPPDEQQDHSNCGLEKSPPDDNAGNAPAVESPLREQLRRQTAKCIIDHYNTRGEWAVPPGLRKWAQTLLEPKIDWRRLLAAELRKGLQRRPGTDQTDWTRLPRRPDDGPFLRPGAARPSADVAVVIDTSGSMRDSDHKRAIAETNTILKRAVPGEAIRIYSADHDTHSPQTVNRTGQITLVGGGGTDMDLAIRAVASDRPRPAVIIVITDGYTPWPPTRPHGNTAAVIAVLTRPHNAAYVPPWITAIEAHASETEQ